MKKRIFEKFDVFDDYRITSIPQEEISSIIKVLKLVIIILPLFVILLIWIYQIYRSLNP